LEALVYPIRMIDQQGNGGP